MSEAPKLSYAGQAGAQALLALIAYELQTCVIKILPAIAGVVSAQKERERCEAIPRTI